MKLRMQGNAIRFRLTRKEVEEFARSGRVSVGVPIGDAVLTYSLERGAGPAPLTAAFTSGEVVVRMAESAAAEWTSTELVGLHADQPLAGGGTLGIDIEKDFQCMHKGDDARDPDAYPNPLAAVN